MDRKDERIGKGFCEGAQVLEQIMIMDAEKQGRPDWHEGNTGQTGKIIGDR